MNDSHDAEYLEHARMWHDFTRLMTYGIVVVIIILLGMAVTIA